MFFPVTRQPSGQGPEELLAQPPRHRHQGRLRRRRLRHAPRHRQVLTSTEVVPASTPSGSSATAAVWSRRTAYLSQRARSTDGQIIQSGQPIGYVGKTARAGACGIYFAVEPHGKRQNPTAWLNTYVGKTPPVAKLFGNTGFNVASFNILGASHTARSSRYATYTPRLNRAVTLMNSAQARRGRHPGVPGDAVRLLRAPGATSKTWGAYYWNPAGKKRDTENAIIWRKSTMEFVSGHDLRHPLLQRQHPARAGRAAAREVDRAHGVLHQRAQPGQRARATQRSSAPRRSRSRSRRSSSCAATGRPVFLTGDFNDRAEGVLPADGRTSCSISPNSIPSMTCVYPRQSSIDWIFAAGQTRFSYFAARHLPAAGQRISDHPVVQARAHLQN